MAWADTARLIDVSHWNPETDLNHRTMDWRAAAGAGCVGMICKYSQGVSGVDPAAFAHAYAAFVGGVPLLGGYHFGDGSDPEKQAKHFLQLMKDDYGGNLSGRLLMLDAEQNSPQMTVKGAEVFVQTIHDAVGRWPWLYMGRSGPDGTGRGLPSTILSQCTLLLPKYGPTPTAAALPTGWRLPVSPTDKATPGQGVMRAWQFTDGTTNGGPFPGLGRVDQSKLIGLNSLAELEAIWAS